MFKRFKYSLYFILFSFFIKACSPEPTPRTNRPRGNSGLKAQNKCDPFNKVASQSLALDDAKVDPKNINKPETGGILREDADPSSGGTIQFQNQGTSLRLSGADEGDINVADFYKHEWYNKEESTPCLSYQTGSLGYKNIDPTCEKKCKTFPLTLKISSCVTKKRSKNKDNNCSDDVTELEIKKEFLIDESVTLPNSSDKLPRCEIQENQRAIFEVGLLLQDKAFEFLSECENDNFCKNQVNLTPKQKLGIWMARTIAIRGADFADLLSRPEAEQSLDEFKKAISFQQKQAKEKQKKAKEMGLAGDSDSCSPDLIGSKQPAPKSTRPSITIDTDKITKNVKDKNPGNNDPSGTGTTDGTPDASGGSTTDTSDGGTKASEPAAKAGSAEMKVTGMIMVGLGAIFGIYSAVNLYKKIQKNKNVMENMLNSRLGIDEANLGKLNFGEGFDVKKVKWVDAPGNKFKIAVYENQLLFKGKDGKYKLEKIPEGALSRRGGWDPRNLISARQDLERTMKANGKTDQEIKQAFHDQFGKEEDFLTNEKNEKIDKTKGDQKKAISDLEANKVKEIEDMKKAVADDTKVTPADKAQEIAERKATIEAEFNANKTSIESKFKERVKGIEIEYESRFKTGNVDFKQRGGYASIGAEEYKSKMEGTGYGKAIVGMGMGAAISALGAYVISQNLASDDDFYETWRQNISNAIAAVEKLKKNIAAYEKIQAKTAVDLINAKTSSDKNPK